MLCPVAVVDIPVNDQDTLGAKAAPGDCRGDGYIVVCNRMDRFYAYTSVHSTKSMGKTTSSALPAFTRVQVALTEAKAHRVVGLCVMTWWAYNRDATFSAAVHDRLHEGSYGAAGQ